MKSNIVLTAFYTCLLSFLLNADESFITRYEYAKMLYQNPRGVGCDKCHGKKGEGDTIARYVHKNEPRTIVAPRINHLSYERFAQTFKKEHQVMPKYFLSESEIESLYYYLHKNND